MTAVLLPLVTAEADVAAMERLDYSGYDDGI